MELFNTAVQKRIGNGKIISNTLCKTEGQLARIVLLKYIFWGNYVRLYVADDDVQDEKYIFLLTYEVSTKKTTDKVVQEIERWFKNPAKFYEDNEIKDFLSPYSRYIKFEKIDHRCVYDPDKYLKRGDHVSIERAFYKHDAIYIGNKKVIHMWQNEKWQPKNRLQRYLYLIGSYMTSAGTGKISATISDWSTFIGDNKTKSAICRVHYAIRVYSRDQIVTRALSALTMEQFQHYNVINGNCQSFATYCCIGVGVSHEIKGKEMVLIFAPMVALNFCLFPLLISRQYFDFVSYTIAIILQSFCIYYVIDFGRMKYRILSFKFRL